MTLISTYLTDFASDSDVALADNPGGMADSLFQQLFWAQLARCEASGVLPTFTDADFVAALRQYIALRPALVDYETRWLAERSSSLGDLGDTGGIVTILSVSSSQPLAAAPEHVAYAEQNGRSSAAAVVQRRQRVAHSDDVPGAGSQSPLGIPG